MTGPRAPHVFWTHRAGVRYAVEQNPWPPGTVAFLEWLRAYWADQAERGFRRAMRLQVAAIVLSVVSPATVILRVIFG